ncbi:MAG: DUF2236 domain-containing protein [Comamonadaceae bacterium]|nr:MAG: DUF2236 domain-containing protein [Comamonadaceae bacterium]
MRDAAPDTLLDVMEMHADPLADHTVATLLGPWADTAVLAAPDAPQWQRMAGVNQALAQWSDNAALGTWHSAPGTDPAIAQPLQAYVHAARSLPHWADSERIERAEVLFMEHGALSCVLLFCASLPECYVIPDLSDVLHTAGQLEQHTEHRIRSTAAMIFPVMLHGGLTRPDGAGVAQVLKVRLIHATIRNLILRGGPAAAASGAGATGAIAALPLPADRRSSLPATLFAHGWDVQRDGLPCNQQELAYTLLTFGYVFLRSLRRLGIGLAPSDEEACLHTWNVVGHLLGIDRTLMIHTMADGADLLARMQRRGRAQAHSPDPRPALGADLMRTMERALPWQVIRPFPRLMTRHLCGRHTARDLGLAKARAPLLPRALFSLLLGSARVADTAARKVWPQFSIVRSLTRVLGYHFMAKILMDQTRPLKLPERLLDQVDQMMGRWSDDPRAPRWLNRLEDRLTTIGSWSARRHPPEERAATDPPSASVL